MITAAGVSAGIDMALIPVTKIAGQVIAQSLQLAIEYDPAPPFDSGSPEKAPHALVARMLTRLRANLRYPDPRQTGNEPAHRKACHSQGKFTF